MELVESPVAFVNSLLSQYDVNTIQKSLQSCTDIVYQIVNLEHLLDKLYYSVLAGKYDDGFLFAKECRSQFISYQQLNQLDKNYIKKLNIKYSEILTIIKNKLLSDFNFKEGATQAQLDQASNLLDLLSEKDKIRFLQELGDQVCLTMPDLPFKENYKKYFQWIVTTLKLDQKYKGLIKWSFEKYLVESWAEKIRDLIINQPIEELTQKMLRDAKKTEDKLRQFHPNIDGIIVIAFDPFCLDKLQKIVSGPPTYNFNLNQLEFGTLETFNSLVNYLVTVYKSCSPFLNNRNQALLIKFFETKINDFVKDFQPKWSEVKFTSPLLIALKKSLAYVNEEFAKLKKVLEPFSIKNTNWGLFIKEINDAVYLFYQNIILSLLKIGLASYYGNILNRFMKTHKKEQDLLDVSPFILQVCEILEGVNYWNENTKLYLLNDINLHYRSVLDVDNLDKILSTDLFTQIILDLSYLKDQLKIQPNLFSEVELKAKFLIGDILNEKNFVAQFKLYYPNQKSQGLHKILAFKKVDKAKIDLFVKIYNS